jgi:alpha-tubulin suppressor-like RCC1 family protein
LGDGTTINKSSPVQIGSLTNWKSISTNNADVRAIKTDGTLWAWGTVSFITGVNIYKSSPVQIGSLTNWKQISTGAQIFSAIKTDGTLWSAGANASGQLGDGTIIANLSSPVQIGSLTNWKQVSAGFNSMSAIKTDGTLWTWGYNYYGQLGDGTIITKSSPVQIGSLTNWKYVESGQQKFTAIKTDGTLWAWGVNSLGNLGDGTIINKSSPVQIGSLTNWKYISCRDRNTLAIKTDGTLWAWGVNGSQGGLMTGATASVSSPVQVGSLTNWKYISAGTNNTAAIANLDILG